MLVYPPSAFYAPPSHVTTVAGTLLRSEPLRGVTLPPGVQGWRILYATSVDDRTPATAVATVFSRVNVPAGRRPVIMLEHGTTGLLQRCMPSLWSMPTRGMPAFEQAMRQGWVVVATDYAFTEENGPHPYIIGEGEARSGLDSLRAARHMMNLNLGERTVVWGYSQGGHSALWTGVVGPRYAPDIKIEGVVGIAPAADPANILSMNPGLGNVVGPYLAVAYSRFYPDVRFDQAVNANARVAARKMASLCLDYPAQDAQRLNAIAGTLKGPVLAASTETPFAKRLAQNAASHAVAAPLLIAQGLTDQVVPARATSRYVDRRCANGQRLEYWTFSGRDHESIVLPGTPLDDALIAWTKERFENWPQAKGCTRKSW